MSKRIWHVTDHAGRGRYYNVSPEVVIVADTAEQAARQAFWGVAEVITTQGDFNIQGVAFRPDGTNIGTVWTIAGPAAKREMRAAWEREEKRGKR